MKKGEKKFEVSIELDIFKCIVKAKDKKEAKKLALEKLKTTKIEKLIARSYPDKRKEIWAEKITD